MLQCPYQLRYVHGCCKFIYKVPPLFKIPRFVAVNDSIFLQRFTSFRQSITKLQYKYTYICLNNVLERKKKLVTIIDMLAFAVG